MTTRSRTRADKAAEADAEGVSLTGEDAETTQTDDGADDSQAESGTRYLNTTGGPLVYDRDGRQVGGGEWTPPVNLDAIGQQQRRLKHLLPPSAV